MQNSRDIFLTIGKKNYSVRTPLSSDDIDRVRALIDQACGSVNREAEQEDLLVLTCLRLAYSLDALGSQVNSAIKIMNEN